MSGGSRPPLHAEPSDHSLERWAERFPDDDIADAFGRAERVLFSRVMGWAEAADRRWAADPRCQYWFDPATEALFVLSGGADTIITVFPVRRDRRKRRSRRERCWNE